MKHGITLLALAGMAMACGANEPSAATTQAETVCAACHGRNGVSVSDTIPNLAGQKPAYLQNQLKAWKDGTRKNALMNAIAAQLGADDITQLAAHFAAMPGAGAASAKSELLPSLTHTGVSFPAGYPAGFTMYQTVNRPDIGQVRYLYANATALQAARDGRPLPDGAVLVLEQHAVKRGADGKPLTGSDGSFQSERLLAHAVMARGPGWGQAIPELLSNEDWNYAVFSPTGQLRPGVNQAECLACHKPLDKTSFTFSLNALATAARAR